MRTLKLIPIAFVLALGALLGACAAGAHVGPIGGGVHVAE